MTTQKRDSWFAHGCAVIGVMGWIGGTMYFGLYPLTIIIAVFAVPATIYNIVREARCAEPMCR